MILFAQQDTRLAPTRVSLSHSWVHEEERTLGRGCETIGVGGFAVACVAFAFF